MFVFFFIKFELYFDRTTEIKLSQKLSLPEINFFVRTKLTKHKLVRRIQSDSHSECMVILTFFPKCPWLSSLDRPPLSPCHFRHFSSSALSPASQMCLSTWFTAAVGIHVIRSRVVVHISGARTPPRDTAWL